MHAVLTRPSVRASLSTLLADASAHAAAAQRSIVERLGEGWATRPRSKTR